MKGKRLFQKTLTTKEAISATQILLFAEKKGEMCMKLLKGIMLASALYFSSCAAPQIRDEPVPARIVQVPKEARVPDNQRPSYLSSLPPAEELNSMSPVDRIVLQYVQNARDLQSNTPELLFTNGSPRRVLNINGTNVSIELPYYRFEGNRIRNIVDGNLDDPEMVFNDFRDLAARSNNIAFEHFQQVDANANRRVSLRAGNFDENASVEGLDGVTLGTVLGVQHHTRASLLPRKFILANLDDALAITRLHENVIVYAPMARQADEIWGQPRVAVHELWHLSQNIVDAFGTNVELYAYSADLNLSGHNPLTFLVHPYGAETRRLAKTYYGFDASQALRGSISNRISNLVELDENVLASHYNNTAMLASRFGSLLHNEVDPEYRSFSPYWAMMQQYYMNPNLLLRLAVAKDGVPVGMARAERTRFLVQHRQDVDRIITEANSQYVPPRIMQFGPFRIVDGVTIEDLIAKKCHDAGFNEAQADYVFHLFLKKAFFNGDGSYNYSNISLSNAVVSMSNFTSQFSGITDAEFERYFPNSTPEVRALFSQYQWYNKRLETASRYHHFAKEQGLTPNDNFVPGIFDPRFNLETFYQVRPEYTRTTSNMSLRSTNRVRVNGAEYHINNYDLLNSKGFSNGIDYISVFRIRQNGQLETNPCLILFAGNNSNAPNFALIDNDREGNAGYGIYDSQVSVAESTSIESLLSAPVTHAPMQPIQSQPRRGNFVPPDYSSWQSRMEEYDADLDGKTDSIAVLYQNGGHIVRELYKMPEGYDDALVTGREIMLSRRGLLEIVSLSSLSQPYALQITENDETRTLFDNNGYGIYRQMLR